MANAHHHVALRVADIERAAGFYITVFGGRWLTKPFVIEGRFAETIYGRPGVRVKVCHVGFDEGTVELFQFIEPASATGSYDPTRANLMHYAIQVEDVDAAVERVEAAGGRALFPVTPWGDARVVYCEDLDGNIVELSDRDLRHIVKLTLDAFPDAAPDAAE